jgi:hypothetical protein
VFQTLARDIATPRRVARWIDPVARVGYATKGLVYLILGGLAVRAALWRGSVPDMEAAMRWFGTSTVGTVAIYALSIGLSAFVAWRLVEAVFDPDHPDGGGKRVFVRIGRVFSAIAYGSLAWTAWQLAERGRSDGRDESDWFALLMAQPFGRMLAFGVGAGVIVYGLYQFGRGAFGDVAKRLRLTGTQHRRLVALGRFGIAARGAVFVILGSFAVDAARRYDPSAVGGTDEALRWLGHGWLMGIVALGLGAYGVFQLAQAAWRRIDPAR